MKASQSFLILSTFSLTYTFSELLADGYESWPNWRGGTGQGHSFGATPPLEWSDESNIKWKTKVDGLGFSTPVIWEDTIYLLTAIADENAPSKGVTQGGGPGGGRQGSPRGGQRSQGGRPGLGGFDREALIKEFDKDGDGELSEMERKALRSEMRSRRGDPASAVAKPWQLKNHPKQQFKVMAIDRNSGDIKWERLAVEAAPHEGHHPTNSFASYSPVTDGERLYVSFGSRGIYCYDLNGNLIWEKNLGNMRTRVGFGEGSSPALAEDKLILLWDHEDQSYIVALDKKSSEEVWRRDRDERTSWTTPHIQEVDGRLQVIVAGTKATRSYDAETGELIWEAQGLTANVISTPVVGHENVYVASGYQGRSIQAIKLSAKGEVFNSGDIVWQVSHSAPYVPSPVLSGDYLYLTKGNDAYLACFDAKTGEVIYRDEPLEGLRGVYASPLVANGHIYFVGRQGTTVVLKDSKNFEVVATNKLNDQIDASPVALGGDLFLRGHNYLYCISEN